MSMHPLSPQIAEDFAISALGWIAGEPDQTQAFVEHSGVAPDQISASATDPGFLVSVLDFILLDDERVIALGIALSRPPEDVLRARAGLPGGDLPHWT